MDSVFKAITDHIAKISKELRFLVVTIFRAEGVPTADAPMISGPGDRPRPSAAASAQTVACHCVAR